MSYSTEEYFKTWLASGKNDLLYAIAKQQYVQHGKLSDEQAAWVAKNVPNGLLDKTRGFKGYIRDWLDERDAKAELDDRQAR